MAGAAQQLRGNLLASLLLVATLLLISVGLPVADRMLPARRPVAHNQAFRVGAGVTVRPPAGAIVDVTATRPADDAGTALFFFGAVRYAIAVRPFDGTLADATAQLRRRITDTPGYQVVGGDVAVSTAGGLAGVQGSYTAPGRGGRYAVFLADNRAIEVTVSAAQPDLGQALPQIDATTRSFALEERP